MQDNDFYQSLVESTSTGYAYCRAEYDCHGDVVDFIFLEANHAFYTLHKLDNTDITGRSYIELIAYLPADLTFIQAVQELLTKNRSSAQITYSPFTDCHYKLDLFSFEPDHFAIQISDVSDIVAMQRNEKVLQERLRNEQLLFQMSRLAMQDHDIEPLLDLYMRIIGEALEFSRVYIFRHNRESDTLDNTHEWVAPGITPEKDNLQGLPGDILLWWTHILEANQNIVYDNIEDIPDENIKSILRPQGIKSLLVVPLFVDSEYYGFMGFDECVMYRCWVEDDIQVLQSMAFLVANSIRQKRDQQILQQEHKQLLSLFESIYEPIYVSDMSNYEILYTNRTTQKVFGSNLVGKPCYEVLQNRTEPCDYCTNSIIQALDYQPYEWEYYNPRVNRHYQIVDRMIRWSDGRNVRFEMAIDVTNYRRATRELQTEKERLNVTLHSIGEGVISTDQNGTILLMNSVAEDLTGWWREEAIGKNLSRVLRILHENANDPCPDPVAMAFQLPPGRNAIPSNGILMSRNGVDRTIEYTASPIKDDAEEVFGVVVVFRDVTKQKKEAEEIRFLSYHDRLTGLFNRTFFERELSRLDTQRQLPVSLIMGDVNGLKITNDVFGHQEGDRLLRYIAGLLQDSCRAEDIIARWGGDEFVILLPQTDHESAQAVCERIEQACRDSRHNNTHVSISLGTATKERMSDDIMQILRQAEESMYKRKLLESKSARNAIVASVTQTLFAKNLESQEHTHRLSQLCRGIGINMGLKENELNELELLAMLHDIGKIALNDDILNKSGPLTESDKKELQRHTEIGYRIAQSVPDLSPIAECILSHHEWWNGHGYPQGLSRYSIPLAARILAVVDAYDSYLEGTLDHSPLPESAARQELARGAGTRFDPDVVNVLLEKVLQ